jgi:isopenicillin-N synthase
MKRQAEVPTIDIAPLFAADGAAKRRVAREIDRACRGDGFFFAAGHGINVHRLQDVVEAFHQRMTTEEKRRIAINAYNEANPHVRNGYYMATPGKKAVESFCYLNPAFTLDHPRIVAGIPMHEVNRWPDEMAHPGFRDYCEDYFSQMLTLSRALLRGFALALGRDESYFDAHVTAEDTLSAVSLIRYPRIEHYPQIKTAPDGQRLSFDDHVDVSIITVLFQTPIPNLQVETADGWLDLPVSSDDYLINAGTFLEYLTNSHYRAPNHRVKFINAARLSLPFFVHASHTSRLEPFHPAGAHAGGNNAIDYGDYLQNGLRMLINKNGQT